ncbi:MAG: catechol 2,3-dioxygenase-like lactoylglutathione lyase family enzyme [Planctomycetota bacterium]|jgi:catechol 2,3-dioxygenase-like lactoylglutathione lyase family enzyme
MSSVLNPLAFLVLAGALVAPLIQEESVAAEEPGAFSRTTIDVGMVVSDLDAAAKFYGETLGFSEASGFSVGAEFCSDAGLTDARPLTIRVFALGSGDDATKVKLMQRADGDPKQSDNSFIDSQLGLSYLTVFVSNLNDSIKRLAAANVPILGKGPVALGADASSPQLILVRDPDGNLIELIGPRL